MMEPLANFSLQLIVKSFSTFRLIDTLSSEEASAFEKNPITLHSEGAIPVPIILYDKLQGRGLIVDFISI
jgi:hypothetical protein